MEVLNSSSLLLTVVYTRSITKVTLPVNHKLIFAGEKFYTSFQQVTFGVAFGGFSEFSGRPRLFMFVEIVGGLAVTWHFSTFSKVKDLWKGRGYLLG